MRIAVVLAMFLPALASAREVAVRTAVVVRARPQAQAAVVDRVSAGQMVSFLGRNGDGTWVRVRSRHHEGWAPFALLDVPPDVAAPPVVAHPMDESPPLAPPRATHPEAWVAQSRYHDGAGRARVIAAVSLRARPAADARVLGQAAIGDELAVVRRSVDGAWWLVDSGAGEVAWVEADALDEQHRAPAATRASSSAASAPVETTASPAPVAAEVVVEAPQPTRKGALALGVSAGVSVLTRRFVSDGTGPLSAFQLSTNTVEVGAGASYGRAVGRVFRWGIDAGYAYAGAASVRWRAADGTTTLLGVQAHQIGAGVSAGLHFRVAGGLDMRARVGGRFDVNVIEASASLQLPSDRLLGLTVGAGAELPRLAAPGGHSIGVHAQAIGLVLGQRTENVEEGRDVGSWGMRFGGGLSLALWQHADRGRVVAVADYAYDLTVTRLNGPSLRDPTVTHANLGTEQHIVTAGLAYAY